MHAKKLTSIMKATAGVAVIAMLATGCLKSGGDDGDDSGTGSTDGSGGSAGAGGSEPNDGVVEVFGAFTGVEQEAFEASVADWEAENDIDIQYTGNSDFTTFIRSRVQGGDPPDIAFFPQPGLLLDLASGDNLVPIDEYLDTDQLNDTLIPGFLDAVTDADGTVWGAPMRMAVKSLVWVPKPAFADAGFPVEYASYQDLVAQSQEIADSGTAPWCIGYEAGAGTGWVGTDWLEEMVLRTAGPDVYDQWVTHEIPFNDPQIAAALDAYGEIHFGDGFVFGGPSSVVTTSFQTAFNPAFEDPVGCYMMRNGNFITGFFPEDVQASLDESVDLFVLPPYDGGYDGQPILGGGDLAGLMNGEDDDAKQVMAYITSDQFGAAWAQSGGWLSPHATFDISNYADETTQRIAELVADADVFRFDASDLMPAEVGAGTFWTGMDEWATGQKTTEEVLTEIEESWPSS